MAIKASPLDTLHSETPGHFPPQVKNLAWREREIATIVYARGASTAKDIEAGLSNGVSNAAIRSMLKRLVRKGVLKRRRSGLGKAFVYVAAITSDDVKHMAVNHLANDYFGGSLLQAALAIIDLLEKNGDATALVRTAAAEQGQRSLSDQFQIDVAA